MLHNIGLSDQSLLSNVYHCLGHKCNSINDVIKSPEVELIKLVFGLARADLPLLRLFASN